MTSMTRRLRAAILNADAVGYSRMMADDDLATVMMLQQSFARFTSSVRRHGGRIVNDAGDNLLAAFPDETAALQCAIHLQRMLAAGDGLTPRSGMTFRIGVHAGDALACGGRLFGDVVNVAARLQSAAEASGICVSETVADGIDCRLARQLVDEGPRMFKNIPRPVRVLRVPLET